MNIVDKSKSKRCQLCGFRIKGANHEEGEHHQRRTREWMKIGNRTKWGKKKKR